MSNRSKRCCRSRLWQRAARFASCAALASVTLPAFAAPPAPLDIPSGQLDAALEALSRQAGVSIGMVGALPRHETQPVRGRIDVGRALARMLAGTGLRAVRASASTWRLEPAPRPAQPPRASAPPAPIDIIVTATKRDQYLADVPISLSVVRPDMAASLNGPRGVHDLLGSTEGAFSTNLGPGRDRIFLRGVADSPFNGPTQSTVNLFLDDARVSYATPDPDLRLVDIDRVELLRGPQGTLYGSGALGGIVRIVPTKPSLDHWSGMAAIEGNLVAHGGQGGALESVINLPVIPDRLGVRWAGYIDHEAGWIDDTGRLRKNVNRARRFGGRGALRWRPGDDWTVDLALIGQWLDVRDSQYATRGLARSTARSEPHDNDFLAATATVRGRIADLDFSATSAFVSHDFGSTFDASSVAAARGLPAPLAYQEVRILRLATQEVRLSDPLATHPWVVGAALLKAENILRTDFLPAGRPALRAVTQDDDSLEAALFGEITQPLGGGFALTGGARSFASRVDNEQEGLAGRRANKSGFTPSATLSWHPSDRTLIWLRYASAIRPGGINPAEGATAKAFRSDRLDSVEWGWRLRRWDGRLQLNGTMFGLRWRDVQSDILGTDTLVRTINAGAARNLGAELGSTLDFHPLTIEASLTAQHARLYRPSAAAGAAGDDNRLPVLPDWAGGVRLSWHVPVGKAATSWSIGARYLGTARLSFDPALSRSMGGYWTSDAGISATLDDWSVALSVANLTDRRGNSFGFGNPFTLPTLEQRTPINPRTLSLRIQRNF